MTAEIFLAVFLASVLVAALQWVFVFTVYRPVQRWLANRAWDRMSKEGVSPINDIMRGMAASTHGAVKESLARAPRFWLRQCAGHLCDRMHVLVEIPGEGWRLVLDEPWPTVARHTELLWDGDLAHAKTIETRDLEWYLSELESQARWPGYTGVSRLLFSYGGSGTKGADDDAKPESAPESLEIE